MQQVAIFCTLPQVYPSQQKWTAEDNKHYKPITKDIVDSITHELTLWDIEQDPNWITKSSWIVTCNVGRAIINAEAAKAFGQHNNVPVLRWKRKSILIFHSQPMQYFMMKMKDQRSLLILFKEEVVKFEQCSWQCVLWCCKWHCMYTAFISITRMIQRTNKMLKKQ